MYYGVSDRCLLYNYCPKTSAVILRMYRRNILDTYINQTYARTNGHVQELTYVRTKLDLYMGIFTCNADAKRRSKIAARFLET